MRHKLRTFLNSYRSAIIQRADMIEYNASQCNCVDCTKHRKTPDFINLYALRRRYENDLALINITIAAVSRLAKEKQ